VSVRVVGVVAAAVVLLVTAAGAEPREPAQRAHVVVQGDTLGAIASRYNVTVSALVTANRLPSERARLRIGQRLVIPPPAPRVAATPPAAAPPRASSARPGASAPPGASASATTPAPPGGRPARLATQARAAATPVRPPVPGPRGLELAVPDFVEVSPPFGWPVEGPITSTFGRRRSGWHRGIDIKANQGAVVFAAAAGTIAVSAVEPRYGRVVKIDHDDGYMTVYAHNEENLVEAGMRVAAGDPIATIGRTGRATAHHLHFEIRRNGSVYNPLYLLPMPPRVGQVEEGEESDEEHE
jgi:lipoprotein NlpD